MSGRSEDARFPRNSAGILGWAIPRPRSPPCPRLYAISLIEEEEENEEESLRGATPGSTYPGAEQRKRLRHHTGFTFHVLHFRQPSSPGLGAENPGGAQTPVRTSEEGAEDVAATADVRRL